MSLVVEYHNFDELELLQRVTLNYPYSQTMIDIVSHTKAYEEKILAAQKIEQNSAILR